MAWTAVRTYTAGLVMTASIMNEISDNLKYLKGSAGTVALDAGLTASGVITATGGIVAGGTVSGFIPGGPVSGNTHITVSGIVTAQAGLIPIATSGKGSLMVSGTITAQAGITSISHISALGNLAVSGIVNARIGFVTPTHISTAGNIMADDVDGVDLSAHNANGESSGYHGLTVSPRMVAVDCGSYVGTGSGQQAVSHSLGHRPYLVSIQSTGSGYHTALAGKLLVGNLMTCRADQFFPQATSAITSTAFYVGVNNDFSDTAEYMNVSGLTYLWAAVAA